MGEEPPISQRDRPAAEHDVVPNGVGERIGSPG